MGKQRTIYLDIIRIVACVMVITMHAPLPGEGALAHGSFLVLSSYLTSPCVPLFFMVSGALLLPCKEGVTANSYIKKRIGKIVGPTICFSIFYIMLNSSELSVKEGVTDLFSIPFTAQGHGILWFMYTLAGLYLLVPIVSPWLRNASKYEIEIYLALWLVTLLYPYIGLVLKINTSNTGLLYYFSGYAGYFLLGHYMSRYALSLRWLLPLALLMLPLPVLNKVLGWELDFYSAFWYLSAPVAMMTAGWFALIKIIFEKIEMGKTLLGFITMVSNLSFGIYLIHIFVMRTLLYEWSVIQGFDNYYKQTFAVVVLTCIGSFVSCYIISKLPLSQYIIGYTVHKKK